MVGTYLYATTIYTDTVDTDTEYCIADVRTKDYYGIVRIEFSDSEIQAYTQRTDNVPVSTLKIYGINF